MQHKNGFIVMLVLHGGSVQPVFREDEVLMFFNKREDAQAEIDECIKDVKDAVAKGDMDSEYTQEDYAIYPAILIDEKIVEVLVDGELYSMYLTEEDLTLGSKFILLDICTRDGEREYTSTGLHILPANETVEKFTEEYARDYFGYDSEDEDAIPKPQDGGYYHCCSEVHVHVQRFALVPFADYLIISKYIV